MRLSRKLTRYGALSQGGVKRAPIEVGLLTHRLTIEENRDCRSRMPAPRGLIDFAWVTMDPATLIPSAHAKSEKMSFDPGPPAASNFA